ncbi:hypothetical protein, partial [Niveispirillum sp. KHB5.9]|uniref:hypothetical protein n=1 Tax=Niveispirillum sp. KHB5.9 TaxID=3400269 RepID=UPI003A83F59E
SQFLEHDPRPLPTPRAHRPLSSSLTANNADMSVRERTRQVDAESRGHESNKNDVKNYKLKIDMCKNFQTTVSKFKIVVQ